jgi:hypothetical protein
MPADAGTADVIPGIATTLERVLSKLSPTSPETRALEILCPENVARVSIFIRATPAIRRLNPVVKIPARGIKRMELRTLGSFLDRTILLDLVGDEYRLNLANLDNPEEAALLSVDYDLPSARAVESLASATSKADLVETESEDLYWMQAALRNPAGMERAYGTLDLRDFPVTVNVGIFEKVLAAIPSNLIQRFKALKTAVSEQERGERLRALLRYHHARTSASSTNDLSAIAALRDVFTTNPFRRFVNVDRPFMYEAARPASFSLGAASIFELPKFVTVESRVDLSLRRPAAEAQLKYKAGSLKNHLQDLLGTEKRWEKKLESIPDDAPAPEDDPPREGS